MNFSVWKHRIHRQGCMYLKPPQVLKHVMVTEHAPVQPPRLLEQVRAAIRYKHDSIGTERAYVYWVRFFIRQYTLLHASQGRRATAFWALIAVNFATRATPLCISPLPSSTPASFPVSSRLTTFPREIR